MQKWPLSQHHSIPFWDVDNIYKILTALNVTKFTICQVDMSIKLTEYLITPLFITVKVSSESDVVVVCNIIMKEEAEGLLSYFGIYVEVIFSSVVWEAVIVLHRKKYGTISILPLLSLCH